MIIDSFDDKSRPYITAKDIYGEAPRNDLVVIATFKKRVVDFVIEKYKATLYASFHTTNDFINIYSFKDKGKEFLIYMSGITSPLASIIMNEVSTVTGAHKFIFFGSCGVLDEKKCRGKFIIPNSAIRDEGTSFHYLPASEEVEIRNHKVIEEVLKEKDIPYVVGKVWTTDAIYMETLNKVNQHKKEGAIAVEMEVSAVEAVGRYLDIDNYHLLFSADSLEGTKWERTDLGGDNELSLQIASFGVALEIAHKISKKDTLFNL